MLLGSHPDICTVGELKLASIEHLDDYRCSCRRLLVECDFWRQVREKMAQLGLPLDLRRAGTDYSGVDSAYVRRLMRPLLRGAGSERLRDAALSCSPTWRCHLRRAHTMNGTLARVVCELSGKRLIADSSKTSLRLKYLLQNPYLDVKVVRMIRDGRAVALTYVNPATFADATDPALRAGGTGRVERHHRLTMEAAAREWRRSNEEGAAAVAQLPANRSIEVRYEDLCPDPQAQVARIFRFADVRW